MNILHISAFASLLIQIITGGIEAIGLTFRVRPEDEIVKEVLLSELIVQFVEFLFYLYLVYKIVYQHVDASITSQRYIDWAITTPIMLINFAVFFKYLGNKTKGAFKEIIQQEKLPLTYILLANAAMLLFGYLGEIGVFNIAISTAIGFIPFAFIFKQLYSRYVGKDLLSLSLFYFTFFIWGIYGIAAVLPFTIKNTLYNFLDLFSKNAFGLFLFGFLYKIRSER